MTLLVHHSPPVTDEDQSDATADLRLCSSLPDFVIITSGIPTNTQSSFISAIIPIHCFVVFSHCIGPRRYFLKSDSDAIS